jgi:hypothetical protein
MRKITVFGVTMLSLVLLMSFMPMVHASVCYWDTVRFVYGHEGDNWIKYPHPDRNYYNISPYTMQGINGEKLHHLQIDTATAVTVVAAADVLCACIGAKIGGVVGALVGAALGVVITYVAEVCFFDEVHCIWVWLAKTFVDWLHAYEWILFIKSLSDPFGTMSLILTNLLEGGYVQVGTIRFLDDLDISSGGLGGVTTTSADKLSLMAPQIATTLLACVALVFMRRKFGRPLHHLTRL